MTQCCCWSDADALEKRPTEADHKIRRVSHDLRRHAARYVSRSGVPIEIVSKMILRHANLSTTQRYFGKISDTEAARWIENLYG